MQKDIERIKIYVERVKRDLDDEIRKGDRLRSIMKA